jgi:hypothetical protein
MGLPSEAFQRRKNKNLKQIVFVGVHTCWKNMVFDYCEAFCCSGDYRLDSGRW